VFEKTKNIGRENKTSNGKERKSNEHFNAMNNVGKVSGNNCNDFSTGACNVDKPRRGI
jgi:hypothetical protein